MTAVAASIARGRPFGRPSPRPGADYDALFGHFSYYGAPASAEFARREITLWQEGSVLLGHWEAKGVGLGGLTFDPHHAYDPGVKVLYLGDGTKRRADNMPAIVTTIAGNGDYQTCVGACGDGGPALAAPLGGAHGVAVGPDGSVYVAYNTHIGRISPDGVYHIVAGTGGTSLFGEGVPARQTDVWGVYAIAVDELGQLYFVENSRCVIRKIDTLGLIHTIAGTKGQCVVGGDGGPASAATINPGGNSLALARASDGAMYFTDDGKKRVRKIGTDGIVQTVMVAEDWNSTLQNLAVAPDDSLYAAKWWSGGAAAVYRLDAAGKPQLVAGGGNGADGGPATVAAVYRRRASWDRGRVDRRRPIVTTGFWNLAKSRDSRASALAPRSQRPRRRDGRRRVDCTGETVWTT